ncbi:hypothetical protein AB0E27_37905 [Streptomyces sparsogenes]|uniref:hypothetical protein n=1 Tax=Streptomyces sparsogenes TaxID=67365 RepID=UPI0033E41715
MGISQGNHSARGVDHSFAMGVGLWRADRCLDDLDVLGLEYDLEGVAGEGGGPDVAQ